MNGWLGEVQGLEISLEAAKRKLASLDRSLERDRHNGPTNLGMPTIGHPQLFSRNGSGETDTTDIP
jgi:hypothetical protein